METTPKAMEIEYIRIKRLNQGREKAYATGTNVICCYYGSRKIEPFKKFMSTLFTRRRYILNLKKDMNRKIRSRPRQISSPPYLIN